jgi:alpha-galactosidase/6-phospho-beta-glucosidase family protein
MRNARHLAENIKASTPLILIHEALDVNFGEVRVRIAGLSHKIFWHDIRIDPRAETA